MKTIKIILTILVLLLLVGCGSDNKDNDSANDKVIKETTGMTTDEIDAKIQEAPAAKKYPIKSGIITFARKGVIGDQKVIVYFDDYGIKERSETYNADGSVDEIKFSDGELMYKITPKYSDEKIAYIMGSGKFGTEMKFDPDPFRNDDERKQKYQFKKLPDMNILGKDCEAYSTTVKMGTTTFAGNNGILLYTKAEISIGTMETIAVEFKEDATVDPNLFKVPEGYTSQKI